MTNLIGEFECRLDPKGRLMLPAALKKQIPVEADDKFVMNRGFEECLVLYPKNEWDITSQEINALNLYSKDNRNFVRNFYRGATELTLDGTNRLLLPKNLLEHAGIDKDLVLFAYANRIEVWSKEKYDTMLAIDPDTYADLAEKVMVKQETPKSEDVS
jgi:MraZ protein